MKKLILTLLIACSSVQISTHHIQQISPSIYDSSSCYINQDLTYEYQSSSYNFIVQVFKSVAVRGKLNFVFSSTSIWLMVAALAEGTDFTTQQKLFQLLSLPKDPCIRQAFYQLATTTTRVFPSNEVNIKSTRVLLIDDGATLNPAWYHFIEKNSLLEVIRAPIRYNPIATAHKIQRIMSSRLTGLDLTGNSVLLDTLDYNGLWTTAFADALIERAPFYNQQGEAIGAVDIMRVKRRARMVYHKKLHAKMLELPIGSDERYRMVFGMIIGNNNITSSVASVTGEIVLEFLSGLRTSLVPIDVAIPRVVINSDIDMRVILQDLAVNELWTDPAVTRYISNPPALPTSFLQRASLVLNSTGVGYAPPEPESAYSTDTGLDPILGRDFIANRPFLFGLFDTKTWTCLMTASITKPTYT